MVVPESSHDRSCSKESPKNVPSTITIPESASSPLADSEIMLVDVAFWDDLFQQDRSSGDFRVSTKILQDPGCQLYQWFLELIAN